jgi:hypothetical protein
MSDTPTDRPFRWYATEKIARLEAEIEDLKDDKRVFLSHLNLLADLLTPDQGAKARKLLDVTPRMEFLSKTLALQQENAALRADKERLDWLETTNGSDWAAMSLNEGNWITRAAIDAARKEEKP